jgi:hypothetical protein
VEPYPWATMKNHIQPGHFTIFFLPFFLIE